MTFLPISLRISTYRRNGLLRSLWKNLFSPINAYILTYRRKIRFLDITLKESLFTTQILIYRGKGRISISMEVRFFEITLKESPISPTILTFRGKTFFFLDHQKPFFAHIREENDIILRSLWKNLQVFINRCARSIFWIYWSNRTSNEELLRRAEI